MKSYRHYILAFRLFCLCAVASLAGCSDMDDDQPVTTQGGDTYVKVTRLAIPVTDGETEESATVNSVRILLFNPNDGYRLTANHPMPTFSKKVEYWSESGTDPKKHVIITPYTTDQSKLALKANPGKNLIYIVLNEKDGFGTDLSNDLNGLTVGAATKEQLETILKSTATYSELIPVGEDAKTDEPAFVMCTYDEIDLSEIDKGTASGTEEDPVTIDMTGRMSADAGFGMRRPMAKITFDGFYGGVNVSAADRLRNVEEGTDWRALLEPTDTLSATNDKEKELLTALSAIHVLDMQLVNVPQGYSFWDAENAEGDFDYDGEHNGNDRPVYNGAYNGPFPLYPNNDFQKENGYLDREWPGQIKVSGTVPFSVHAQMKSVYKNEMNSGTDYSEFPTYQMGMSFKGKIQIVNKDVNNRTANGPYDLNTGNFPAWFGSAWNPDYVDKIGYTIGEFQPTVSLTPAVWKMSDLKGSYYVPENIQEGGPDSRYTKIRLTVSVATPSVAVLDEEAVKAAIDAWVEANKNNPDAWGTVDSEVGETLPANATPAQIDEFCWKVGQPIYKDGTVYSPKGGSSDADYDSEDALWKFLQDNGNMTEGWSIVYGGITRNFSGTSINLQEALGKYIKIRQEEAKQVFTIDIPLNNAQNAEDEDGRKDHNIYRGHEYRVQLFLTGKPDAAGGWTEIKNAATRAFGGIGLGIAARVERVPVKW